MNPFNRKSKNGNQKSTHPFLRKQIISKQKVLRKIISEDDLLRIENELKQIHSKN